MDGRRLVVSASTATTTEGNHRKRAAERQLTGRAEVRLRDDDDSIDWGFICVCFSLSLGFDLGGRKGSKVKQARSGLSKAIFHHETTEGGCGSDTLGVYGDLMLGKRITRLVYHRLMTILMPTFFLVLLTLTSRHRFKTRTTTPEQPQLTLPQRGPLYCDKLWQTMETGKSVP